VLSKAFVARRNGKIFITGNSGFPKSHDVSKAIDKMLGAESEVVRSYECAIGGIAYNGGDDQWRGTINVTRGTTDAAKQWDGWGTALKPAFEPVVVARKPLVGPVAQNVLECGCGGLNLDRCRVGTDRMPVTASDGTIVSENTSMAAPNTGRIDMGTKVGRWPANFVHDGSDEVVGLFPETGPTRPDARQADQGGSAARFFYTAKAGGDRDRPHGKRGAVHPTVKPLDLMRYLVRLVCPKEGTVLDPFMGSGSTGCAAIAEGMHFVGIEQSVEYADIAVGRLRLALHSAPEPAAGPNGEPVRTECEAPPPPRRLR